MRNPLTTTAEQNLGRFTGDPQRLRHPQYKDWLAERTTAAQDPQTAARTPRTWWLHPPPGTPRLPTPGTPGPPGPAVRLPHRPLRPAPPRWNAPPTPWSPSTPRSATSYATTTDHQAAIAEWTLHTYTQAPATPAALLAHWTAQDRPQRTRTPKPTTSHPNTHPAGPGTTPTPEESLWARKGWAGRTS
ncbi:Uncharacterised protein [Actinomyces bovis]|uniref:Uncharacterized protein n=1 Tax=Actinomyces bovis TaxID=1658 RepID=A0ABY1VPI4_9ACTO|nr:hypothetical protein [Actinomyces bovis]SPT53829.1 Uncharacterised protein [Actinomyces bovis]VEG53202.1 Uncharacterised protein [Actinomyces israelii]